MRYTSLIAATLFLQLVAGLTVPTASDEINIVPTSPPATILSQASLDRRDNPVLTTRTACWATYFSSYRWVPEGYRTCVPYTFYIDADEWPKRGMEETTFPDQCGIQTFMKTVNQETHTLAYANPDSGITSLAPMSTALVYVTQSVASIPELCGGGPALLKATSTVYKFITGEAPYGAEVLTTIVATHTVHSLPASVTRYSHLDDDKTGYIHGITATVELPAESVQAPPSITEDVVYAIPTDLPVASSVDADTTVLVTVSLEDLQPISTPATTVTSFIRVVELLILQSKSSTLSTSSTSRSSTSNIRSASLGSVSLTSSKSSSSVLTSSSSSSSRSTTSRGLSTSSLVLSPSSMSRSTTSHRSSTSRSSPSPVSSTHASTSIMSSKSALASSSTAPSRTSSPTSTAIGATSHSSQTTPSSKPTVSLISSSHFSSTSASKSSSQSKSSSFGKDEFVSSSSFVNMPGAHTTHTILSTQLITITACPMCSEGSSISTVVHSSTMVYTVPSFSSLATSTVESGHTTTFTSVDVASPTHPWTVSTIWATTLVTITSCVSSHGPTCHSHTSALETHSIPYTTFRCPVGSAAPTTMSTAVSAVAEPKVLRSIEEGTSGLASPVLIQTSGASRLIKRYNFFSFKGQLIPLLALCPVVLILDTIMSQDPVTNSKNLADDSRHWVPFYKSEFTWKGKAWTKWMENPPPEGPSFWRQFRGYGKAPDEKAEMGWPEDVPDYWAFTKHPPLSPNWDLAAYPLIERRDAGHKPPTKLSVISLLGLCSVPWLYRLFRHQPLMTKAQKAQLDVRPLKAPPNSPIYNFMPTHHKTGDIWRQSTWEQAPEEWSPWTSQSVSSASSSTDSSDTSFVESSDTSSSGLSDVSSLENPEGSFIGVTQGAAGGTPQGSILEMSGALEPPQVSSWRSKVDLISKLFSMTRWLRA